jgi:hypothetical protein
MKTISMTGIEDWLPDELKKIKRAALAGDTQSEFDFGLLTGNLGSEINDLDIVEIGVRFMARAAKKGHANALQFFSSGGKNWRNYDY